MRITKLLAFFLSLCLTMSFLISCGTDSTTVSSAPSGTVADSSTGGECKHNYQERDGRVICTECKEICDHEYRIDEQGAYCINCLYSCKHSYADNSGKMVCGNCGLECSHEFNKTDGVVKCKHCSMICEHNYEESNGKKVCASCGDEKIVLSIDNVNDFFAVSVNVYDVKITDNYILDKDMGRAKVDISVTNKKNYKYNSVVLFGTLQSQSYCEEWGSWLIEIHISNDGKAEITKDVSSRTLDYISKNPKFDFTITDVTGEIAE